MSVVTCTGAAILKNEIFAAVGVFTNCFINFREEQFKNNSQSRWE